MFFRNKVYFVDQLLQYLRDVVSFILVCFKSKVPCALRKKARARDLNLPNNCKEKEEEEERAFHTCSPPGAGQATSRPSLCLLLFPLSLSPPFLTHMLSHLCRLTCISIVCVLYSCNRRIAKEWDGWIFCAMSTDISSLCCACNACKYTVTNYQSLNTEYK